MSDPQTRPRTAAATKAHTPRPITVQITREVAPEAAGEVEQWVSRGQAMLRYWPGYLGSGWIRSAPDSDTWHMLYRFSDAKTLKSWERSAQRKNWASELADHVRDERAERRTGIEGWFDTKPFREQAADSPAPPRWKQMIMIFTGFFPMSLLGNFIMSVILPAGTPLVLKVLATTALVMPIMVYFVLPFMTRLFSPWLNRPRGRGPSRRQGRRGRR